MVHAQQAGRQAGRKQAPSSSAAVCIRRDRQKKEIDRAHALKHMALRVLYSQPNPMPTPKPPAPRGRESAVCRTPRDRHGWSVPHLPEPLPSPLTLSSNPALRALPRFCLGRWLLSVMPYEPLGSEDKVKSTKIPPTFSLHRYASAVGDPIGGGGDLAGAIMNDASEHKRTQSVLRMGRSFSVKMSSQGEFSSVFIFFCRSLMVKLPTKPVVKAALLRLPVKTSKMAVL